MSCSVHARWPAWQKFRWISEGGKRQWVWYHLWWWRWRWRAIALSAFSMWNNLRMAVSCNFQLITTASRVGPGRVGCEWRNSSKRILQTYSLFRYQKHCIDFPIAGAFQYVWLFSSIKSNPPRSNECKFENMIVSINPASTSFHIHRLYIIFFFQLYASCFIPAHY